MKKLLNNPFVAGGLALLAIVLVAHSIMGGSGSSRAVPSYDPQPYAETDQDPLLPEGEGPPAAFDPASILALAAKPSSRNLFERRAETAAPAEDLPEEMASATIRVKGVWIQDNRRYVIIDDRMLQPGQSIERVRVERIEPQGVWVATTLDESHFIQPGQSWTYHYPKPKDSSRPQ